VFGHTGEWRAVASAAHPAMDWKLIDKDNYALDYLFIVIYSQCM
jgi:hypothetical protein